MRFVTRNHFCLSPLLALALFGNLPVSSEAGAEVQAFGPPLPAEIVDYFVPPTRSDEPYIATATTVFHFEKDAQAWEPIYNPPWPDVRVLAIAGYSKSSQVLYVAHGRGGARTSDQGATWQEFVPLGFETRDDEFRKLIVNPANRREAVLVYRHHIWITRDYGESFEPLEIPLTPEEIRDAGYSGGETPALVVLADHQLVFQPSGEMRWQVLWEASSPVERLAVSSEHPLAWATTQDTVYGFDMSRPGYYQMFNSKTPKAPYSVATDAAARGLLWFGTGNQLQLVDPKIEGQAPATIYESSAPLEHLRAHPREMDELFWTQKNQLFHLLHGLTDAPPSSLTQLNVTDFLAHPVRDLSPSSPDSSASTDPNADQILREITASEPPLQLLIQKALANAFYRHGEVNQWSEKARKRNWLPELRLGGGVREYSTDRSEIVNEVDRFGVPSQNDLRLSDGKAGFGYVGVTLIWNLERLVYDPEQVDIHKEQRYTSKQRDSLITQVTRYYYDRLKLKAKLQLNRESMGLNDRLELKLLIREKTDLLNELCGEDILQSE